MNVRAYQITPVSPSLPKPAAAGDTAITQFKNGQSVWRAAYIQDN
jgi:hypothetical protein